MALEVGRISARIEAQVSDFEQKMAGAQKTFEGVQVKMETVANRATTSLRKEYADRVVAAHQAAQKEIEAARQAWKERTRLASSRAEVAALKKVFEERVAAARSAAQQEIQAAQQSFLGATKNLTPAAGALDAVSKASGRAAPGINSVRSALTALNASALQTAPGVAQVSSVLSAMALGAPTTIAILAGLAAITIAFRKVTAAGDEAIERGERARKAVEAASKTQSDIARDRIKDLKDENRELEKREGFLARAAAFAGAVIPGGLGTLASSFLTSKAQALGKTETDIMFQRTDAQKQLTKATDEENEKRVRDHQEALEKERRAFEKFADEIVRKWQRTQLNLTPFELRGRVRISNAGQVGLIGRTPVDPKLAEILGAVGGAAARGAGAGAGGPGNTVPGKSLIDLLKSRLDPKQLVTNIAGNLLSSGVSAGIGILAKFADGLFDFGGKAREAARQLAEARRQWSVELDRFLADETGKQKIDAAETLRAWIKGFSENFKLTAGRGAILKEFPQIPANLDLEGLIKWVDGFIEANKAFLSDEAIAKWKELQKAAHKLGDELASTTKAANDTVASLINVPTGFKIALARFNATTPVPAMPPTIRQGPRGGFDPVAPNGMNARVTTYIFQGGINVEAKDPVDFLDQLEIEIERKKNRGGSTITLDYS